MRKIIIAKYRARCPFCGQWARRKPGELADRCWSGCGHLRVRTFQHRYPERYFTTECALCGEDLKPLDRDGFCPDCRPEVAP